jgi:alginate O-acetyltransferase complex protein AlgI
MFLGGLWHGANWTFVVWGLYHGLLLGGYHLLRHRGWTLESPIFSRALTFLAVTLGWVFFRAETFGKAGGILRAMAGGEGFALPQVSGLFLAVLVIAAALAFLAPNTWEMKFQPRVSYAYGLAGLLFWVILLLETERPFLYFQF